MRATSPIAGRLWILLAAFLWSASGVFAKSPIFADWSPGSRGVLLAFWRAVFAALVLAAAIRRPRARRELVPLTLAFSAMNAMYLTAMGLTTAANAIWLQSTAPFWVLLVSLVVFRQSVARRELVPLAFAAVGVGLIIAMEVRGTAMTGVLLGLASGLFYGLVVIYLARLSAEDSAWLVALCQAVSALVLLPWVLRLGIWPTPAQLAVLALFGAVQMALPYLCLVHGLRGIGSQEAVGLGLLEPVLMPVWVYLAWGEQPAWWTLAGAVLILAGLALRYSK
jgi:drug/metabolite transporter, DME family